MKTFYTCLSALCDKEIKASVRYQEALSHKSWIAEHKVTHSDYERLEFLGDAILSKLISQHLFNRYPEKNEGQLTQFRSALVNEKALGAAMLEHGLNQFIFLGLGEDQSGGKQKFSILADVYESLLAAIYLEEGEKTALEFIHKSLKQRLESLSEIKWNKDYKTTLQEKVQKHFQTLPTYKSLQEEGPDHNKSFVVAVKINQTSFEGRAGSKKVAQQNAAKKALDNFSIIMEKKTS